MSQFQQRKQDLVARWRTAEASTRPDYNAIADRFIKAIKPGPFHLDPAETGDAPYDELPPREDLGLTNLELLSSTRWTAKIPGDARWDNDFTGNMNSIEESEEESEENDRLPQNTQGRYALKINGERVLVHDYLGKERDTLIMAMHELNDIIHEDPPNASRERFAWQKSGVAMSQKARETFGGSLNVDEMGLGKTVQMIDLIQSQGRCLNDTFNLVITEKAVLTTWAREAADSYTHKKQPRVCILDDSRIDFATLFAGDYDIVLVSYSVVMWQLKRLEAYKYYLHIWRYCGKTVADEMALELRLPTRRPTTPLFTALLYMLPFRIVTKILDEAHKLKKWDGKQRAAVQQIITTYVDLATGTPCGNVWTDIMSICGLLPREPFQGKAQSLKLFASTSSNSRPILSGEVGFRNLIRYLLPFTYGRGVDHLDLQGICYEVPKTFMISEIKSQRTLWLIESFVRVARIDQGEEKAFDEDDIHSAMGFCIRAEQESGFPVLATYSDRQKAAMKKRPIDLKQARANFISAVRDLNANTISSGKAMRLPHWASIDVDTIDTKEFTEAMTSWLLGGGFQGLGMLSMSQPVRHEDDVDMEGMEDMEDMGGMMDDDTAEFQQPDAPNSPAIETQNDETKKGKKAKGSEKSTKHQLFLDQVGKMDDADIFTPRCEALMELYNDIQTRFPGEKILIWSRFYKALVIIAEAMHRRYKIDVPIFSGLLNTEQRDNMLHTWQGQYMPSTVPMCLQAKAGGTGLTVNSASHIIFFEPWWNRLDAMQAERRAYRIGQDKTVHVWNLVCVNSFADALINTGALRKLRTIDRIMDALRTPKGQQVSIPPVVPQYGRVSYFHYNQYSRMDEEDREGQENAQEDAGDRGREEDQPLKKRRRLEEGAYAEGSEDEDEDDKDSGEDEDSGEDAE
ncbi:unnamed protein product [Alternaria alternata]